LPAVFARHGLFKIFTTKSTNSAQARLHEKHEKVCDMAAARSAYLSRILQSTLQMPFGQSRFQELLFRVFRVEARSASVRACLM